MWIACHEVKKHFPEGEHMSQRQKCLIGAGGADANERWGPQCA